MKLDIPRIKKFIDALSKIDKNKINDSQKGLLDFVAKQGLKNEGLLLLLKNKDVFNGIDEFSNLQDLLEDVKRSKDRKPGGKVRDASSKPGVNIDIGESTVKEKEGLGSDPNQIRDIGLDWD